MTTFKTPDQPVLDPFGGGGPNDTSDKTLLRRAAMIGLALLVIAGVGLGILLLGTSPPSDRPDATVLTQTEVTERLFREVGGDVEFEILYTPSWYFEWSRRDLPDTNGIATIGFFVFETVHIGELSENLPNYVATADGTPLDVHRIGVIDDADHHRVTQVLFVAEDENGTIIVEDGDRIELSLSGAMTARFGWETDSALGAGVLSDQTEKLGVTSGSLTVAALFAIFGGMLTALSPCLLLLATYYTAVLGGVATQENAKQVATRKMLTTALWFILGFAVVYTLGGIAAGFVGNSISRLDAVDTWSRPISIVAGLIVVIMGIRTAAQANVPMVCKIPGFKKPDEKGMIGSATMGITFAVGCLSCFSATVLSALLLYAGATGSPFTGGLVMLTFSATVGLIFLIAAFLMTKAVPLVTWVEKARPYIGGISAAVMIFLGFLMITYKFHIFTGWLFELWS
jgi:cytochrome c-type biogenesis protein